MKKPSPGDAPYDEPVWVFPYSIMRVGDSFFIPTMKPAYLTYAADSGAKREGIKVKVFTVTENDVLGIRVWRMS